MSLILFIFFTLFFIFTISKFSSSKSEACMTILVGRRASATGEVLVGHNEDAPGRFTMQTHLVKKKRRHPETLMKFEPDLSPIELYETRNNLFWAEAKTFSDNHSDSAFCDFYVNGHGVVICSNNCASSREDNPELLNSGIGYGLRRLVAEKAHNAREALEIACELVDRYGYASSGRSYAFSDKEEIYVMQIVHGKHYAIARVPDDEVAVIPNHYTIHEPDKKANGYDELINYAIKRGWYKPEDGSFDFAKVYQAENSYGIDKNTYRHVRAFEILLDMDLSELLKTEWQPLPFSIRPAHLVSVNTLKKILRSHYRDESENEKNNPHFSKPLTICNCDTLESTIVQIRHNPDRIILRKALGRPCTSPYITWFFGINSVPEDYENKNAEKSLSEHFHTKPEDMDYKNNAWYRAMELQAVCDILGNEKSSFVSSEIKELEDKMERRLNSLDSQIEIRLRSDPDIARAMMEGILKTCIENTAEFMKNIKKELNIITGEPLTAIREGKNFKVKFSPSDFPKNCELDFSKCKCGTSYTSHDKWSECVGISQGKNGCSELEFKSGEWLRNAAPCFTDLYMILVDKNGRKFAGSVKMQVKK